MGFNKCCVVNCKNNAKNSDRHFYRFPLGKIHEEKRRKWIRAVSMNNTGGSEWTPKSYERICSAHFVGNAKSANQLSPSYIPTIFSFPFKLKLNQQQAANRHSRFMMRRYKNLAVPNCENMSAKKSVQINVTEVTKTVIQQSEEQDTNINAITEVTADDYIENATSEQGCEVNFLENTLEEQTLICCNRYIYSGNKCDAEVQTEIPRVKTKIVIPNRKQFKNQSCGTSEKSFVDCTSQCDLQSEMCEKHFMGFSLIKNDEQLLDLAGVSTNNFNFLLSAVRAPTKCVITKENRLLIFLINMKTGLTFSAISVLFCVHRTTVSRIFLSLLSHLAAVTQNLVFWPDKKLVQATMPQCFQPEYSNTRVILDCTEFRIEVPASVNNRVYCYSHYKRGFTAIVLIGITPAGFICLKSKAAGGRKSDSQLTIESGLIDLLEDGDIILADKGFPDIRCTINDSGKKVVLVMPSFLEKKGEFSKEETEQTYSIARVRIHVERIMQRLRTYQILNKIPVNLFSSIDDIIHVCCVLVNLQPPIISDTA